MKWGRHLFGFLLSGIFLWLALRGLDWGKVLTAMYGVRWWAFIVLPLSYTIEHLIRTWRWKVILGEIPVPFFNLYAALVIGYFCNNIFPARAGEVIRSFYLGRKKLVPTSRAFGSIVMERFLDGIAVMSLIGFSLAHFPLDSAYKTAGRTALGFYLSVLAVILLMQFQRELFLRLSNFLLRPFPTAFSQRILGLLNSFIDGLKTIRSGKTFLAATGLSFLGWGFSVASTYLGLLAFSLPFEIEISILLISVLSLGAMIPSSPGMIGIYEICCRLVFVGILQMDKDLGMSVGIFLHTMSYLYVLAVGIGILAWENIRFAELGTGEEQLPTPTEKDRETAATEP